MATVTTCQVAAAALVAGWVLTAPSPVSQEGSGRAALTNATAIMVSNILKM